MIDVIRSHRKQILLSDTNVLSDNVKYSVIDLLELNNYNSDVESDCDSEDESIEKIKYKVCQRQLAERLKHLQSNTIIINLIGRNDVNETIIKKILPGSVCKMVTFRCKKKKVLKKHLKWLNILGFRRKYFGIKGYLGNSKFKVSKTFTISRLILSDIIYIYIYIG